MKLNLQEQLGQWYPLLKDEFAKDYMQNIGRLLTAEGTRLTPKPYDIFTAYKLCPPGNVKVVIIGQDPYPGVEEAHGLAFSVFNGQNTKSLDVIFRELEQSGMGHRADTNLTSWAKQGVFLLNTILTNRYYQTLAHEHWGWQKFTDRTLRILNSMKTPIVFMAWGRYAQETVGRNITSRHHKVIECSHPAARGNSNNFVGSGCFAKANAFLASIHRTSIVWT